MERIVNGIVFEGKPLPGSWDVRTWTRNGVVERSARQAYQWTELYEVPDGLTTHGVDACGNIIGPREDTPEELEEKRLRSLRKAAQRAKTMCRRVIITENFDELLTLTYRENQQDRALCKKHFKAWVRRMKAALGGGFRYCASFEVQERGAMHVHVATHRLPKLAQYKGVKVKAWEVGTKIWRDIVGKDNGMCFVGGKTRWGGFRRHMSLAKMAAYVSKYIMKDFEDAPSESNRYSRSNGTDPGRPEHIRLDNCSVANLISLCFECGQGDVLVDLRLNRWHDGLWLCTEKCHKPPGALLSAYMP